LDLRAEGAFEVVTPIRFSRALAALAFGLALAASLARADSLAVVPPLPTFGPYPVGCTDVAQDFSRVQPGETAQNYWEGFPNGSQPRYVTQLLSEPQATLAVNVALPDDAELFGNFKGQAIPYVLLVCYPTTTDNPNPDYALPTGNVIPHMQRASSNVPILPNDRSTWPILLFSHGLTGSPISNDYIEALTVFASYGYVVVAPFHGDPRIADVQIANFSDFVYAALHFADYTAMQASRPLSMKAALDVVLVTPGFAGRVDPNEIGGFGASLGAETLLLMAGAQLTDSVGLSSKQVIYDPRLRAIAGYVPYFGQVIFPAFGRDQHGLDNVTVPFQGIAGTADTTAPLVVIAQGVERLTKTRELIALQGVPHRFDFPSAPDIFTWSLTFLSAYTQGDKLALAKVTRMVQVAGGGDDILLLDYNEPTPPGAFERMAIEFYNSSLDHYFVTAEPAEAAMLDAGIIVPGWTRTGFDFKVWQSDAPVGLPVCRFFGTPGVGPNSHFYTLYPAECALVKANPFWTFEGIAFRADAPVLDDCAPDRIPVIRIYNNGKGGQASHRYLTSHSETTFMVTQGWSVEGAAFCALP
jgi:predicted dienelactone hydrolase